MLDLLDKIRGIATEGLHYTKDSYDKDRYLKLQKLVAQEYAPILALPQLQVLEKMQKEFGCVTPKLGVDVAVLNEKNEMLVLQRSDDKTWCVPCGWVDLGETPVQAATREVREETGLVVNPTTCIAVTSKGPKQYESLAHQTNVLLVAKVESGIDIQISHEHFSYKWLPLHESIEWHKGHEKFPALLQKYLDTHAEIKLD